MINGLAFDPGQRLVHGGQRKRESSVAFADSPINDAANTLTDPARRFRLLRPNGGDNIVRVGPSSSTIERSPMMGNA